MVCHSWRKTGTVTASIWETVPGFFDLLENGHKSAMFGFLKQPQPKAAIRNLYGVEPEITWFETPIIVDNEIGEIKLSR